MGNTHTETSVTGTTMTRAYHEALQIIKDHVHAAADDAIICYGSGMTSVVNKFQRILGLRVHEKFAGQVKLPEADRPVVFVTHMEHHSNQTSWIETVAEVQVIHADAPTASSTSPHLAALLERYRARPVKIAAVTSCSNVTGIITPYHAIAGLMHRAGGWCFVDFAASAPYIAIDMHPAGRPDEQLDAIYFSPHKFLGGPGTSGVLVFNKRLYTNRVPDNPGGGTVDWTNPWGEHKYFDDVEAREDGGTPGFTQAIRAALCVRLKESMGVAQIRRREHELLALLWDRLAAVPGLHILADQHRDRLGDHFVLRRRPALQPRGAAAQRPLRHPGPRRLLLRRHLRPLPAPRDPNATPGRSPTRSTTATRPRSPAGCACRSTPPPPTAEVRALAEAVRACVAHAAEWGADYRYSSKTNEFTHLSGNAGVPDLEPFFQL